MADDPTIRIRIVPDATGFNERVEALTRNVGPIKVKVEPDTTGFHAKLRALTELDDTKVKIKLEADFTEFAARLHGFLATLNPVVHVRVIVDYSQLNHLMGEIARLQALLGGMGGPSGGGGGLAGLLVGFRSLSMVAGLAFTAVKALSLLSLVPLAASASQALGVLALIPAAVAGAGAAIATLAIGASGIGAAFSAAKESMAGAGQSAQETARAQRNAAEEVVRAQEAVGEAYRDQARAQDDTRRATDDLNDAYRDQARELRDVNDQLNDAILSTEDAAIGVARAKQNYAKVLADRRSGKADDLDLREADLRVRQAQSRFDQQKKQTADLREDTARANKDGIEGSRRVVDAKQRVLDAQHQEVLAARRLRDAQYALRDAIEAQADALKGVGGPMDAFNQAMQKLSPNAQDFVRKILSLSGAWKELKFSVQDKLFDGLGDKIVGLANNYFPILETGLGRIATAFNSGFKTMIDLLNTPSMGAQWAEIFKNTSVFVERFVSGLGFLFRALTNVAGVGSKFLPGFGQGFENSMKRFDAWIEKISKNGKLKEFIQGAIDKFKELWHIGGLVFAIIGDIFGGSKQTGDDMLKGLSKTLEDWHKYLASPEGQKAVKDFFEAIKDGVKDIKTLVEWGAKLTKWLSELKNSWAGTSGLTILTQLSDMEMPEWLTTLFKIAVAPLVGVMSLIGNLITGKIEIPEWLQKIASVVFAPLGIIGVINGLVTGKIEIPEWLQTLVKLVFAPFGVIGLVHSILDKGAPEWLKKIFSVVFAPVGVLGLVDKFLNKSDMPEWLKLLGKIALGPAGGAIGALAKIMNGDIPAPGWLKKLAGDDGGGNAFGRLGNTLQPFAAGGAIRDGKGVLHGPGTPTSDSILGLIDGVPAVAVSRDEKVMSERSRRGGNDAIQDAMNAGLVIPAARIADVLGLAKRADGGNFADYQTPPGVSGGTVTFGNISGEGITTGTQQSMWDHIRTKFPEAQLFSATRTVQTEGHQDFHNLGKAIDISPMQAIADHIAATFGNRILEMFWDPGPNYDDGKPTGAIGGHSDHVHWAMDSPLSESEVLGKPPVGDLTQDDLNGDNEGTKTPDTWSPETNPKSPDEIANEDRTGEDGTGDKKVDGTSWSELLGSAADAAVSGYVSDTLGVFGIKDELPGIVQAGTIAYSELFGEERKKRTNPNGSTNAPLDVTTKNQDEDTDQTTTKNQNQNTDNDLKAPNANRGEPGSLGGFVADTPEGGIAAGTPGAKEAVFKEWAKYGWNVGSYWLDTLRLLNGESSWTVNAKNPNSTAYGLFQFLDSTQAAYPYGDTAAEQAVGGGQYIKNRPDYGNPTKAYQLWLSRSPHWYDKGGWLQPGETMAKNATGKPEAVLTDGQWADVSGLLDAFMAQGFDGINDTISNVSGTAMVGAASTIPYVGPAAAEGVKTALGAIKSVNDTVERGTDLFTAVRRGIGNNFEQERPPAPAPGAPQETHFHGRDWREALEQQRVKKAQASALMGGSRG